MKTIGDLIFWQYAKIISQSAGYGKKEFGFVMNRFKKLSSGEINWSTSICEYVKEKEKKDECIYCGSKTDLTLEHIAGIASNARFKLFQEAITFHTKSRGITNETAMSY